MSKSKSIAFGGILTALTFISLYLGLIININELFFLFIASCLGIATVILTDVKTAFISYLSVCILSIILLSGNIGLVILYVVLFGLYPFVKLFTEKINNPPVEVLLKLIFLNSGILVTFLLYSKLFVDIFSFKWGVIIALIVLQALYVVYDYALTTFAVFFKSKKKRLKKRK